MGNPLCEEHRESEDQTMTSLLYCGSCLFEPICSWLHTEPDLDFGQLCKFKPCESLSYTVQDGFITAVSIWTEPSLKEYFVARRDIHSHVLGLPFAALPDLPCSYEVQALLCYDGQLFVFDNCSGMSFYNDITVGRGGDGRVLKFIAAYIQGGWLGSKSRPPAPRFIQFRLQVIRS